MLRQSNEALQKATEHVTKLEERQEPVKMHKTFMKIMGGKGSKVSDGDLEALKEAASDIQGKLRRVRDMTKGACPVKTMTQEPLLNQMEEGREPSRLHAELAPLDS